MLRQYSLLFRAREPHQIRRGMSAMQYGTFDGSRQLFDKRWINYLVYPLTGTLLLVKSLLQYPQNYVSYEWPILDWRYLGV